MEQIDIKKLISRFKETYGNSEQVSDWKVKRDLVDTYNDLISLRNRLKYEIEDEYIFEDDIIALDYIMDFLEILFSNMINDDELKKIKEDIRNNLIVNHKKEN